MGADFCELFYASHYLPIAFYGDGGYVASMGFPQEGDPYPFVLSKLKGRPSPAVYVSSDTGYYGMVCGDGGFYVLGPAYSIPVTQEVVSAYLSKNGLPASKGAEVAQFLGGIPRYTYNQFLSLLAFLHFSFTGEQVSLIRSFEVARQPFEEIIGDRHAEIAYHAREERMVHGTYGFERQLLDLVRGGETERLKDFLAHAAKLEAMSEGRLADSPLRQAKNLFIGFVATVGKEAAIPGGLDVEETYRLIDTYTTECERMHTEQGVKQLQYNMLIDFCGRVGQHRWANVVSQEVQACLRYITAHIGESVGVQDMVRVSGSSRASICARFKREVGMTIGAYVTEVKMREARSLLRYTDRSLSEIGDHLGFSSQPYFQNVFKRHVGCTPLAYRRSGGEESGA